MKVPWFDGYRRYQWLRRIEHTRIALVSIAIDVSKSMGPTLNETSLQVQRIVESFYSRFSLVRVITFGNVVTELHWFKRPQDIDTIIYHALPTEGMTAFYDGFLRTVKEAHSVARTLTSGYCTVNGYFYFFTDGEENGSRGKHISQVKEAVRILRESEDMATAEFSFINPLNRKNPEMVEFQQLIGYL